VALAFVMPPSRTMSTLAHLGRAVVGYGVGCADRHGGRQSQRRISEPYCGPDQGRGGGHRRGNSRQPADRLWHWATHAVSRDITINSEGVTAIGSGNVTNSTRS
jgi:hypothetical protein